MLPERRLLVDLSRTCDSCGFLVPLDWTLYFAPSGKPLCGSCRTGIALTILGGNRSERRRMSKLSRR